MKVQLDGLCMQLELILGRLEKYLEEVNKKGGVSWNEHLEFSNRIDRILRRLEDVFMEWDGEEE